MAGFAQALLSVIDNFVQWWVAELAAMVPDRLRRSFAPRVDRLVLLLGQNEAALYQETRQELRKLGDIDLRPDADPSHRVAAILHRHDFAGETVGGRTAVCVRLTADRVLRTTVDLPMAAEANLAEVVSFELDRHTPFHADQAAFAHRIIERDVAAQRLRVNLTVVPRPLIAEALATATRLRLEARSVDVAERGGAYAASGNLLPDPEQAAPSRRRGIVTYGLAGVAVVLAVIVFVLHLQTQAQTEDAIAAAQADMKKSVAAAAALEKNIDALRKEESFLIDRKREPTTVTRLLLDTTHILPDTTWLSEWGISGDEVQLSGYAQSASGLVELLEKSHVFKNTTFQSPTVLDPNGHERFHFSMRLAGDKP